MSHITIMRHQEDKQSKATSALFPIKMSAKQEWTHTITESNNGSINKKQINNNRTTTLERTAAKATGGGGGGKCIYWYQIFALDSAVVEAQKSKLAWRIPNYCNVSS